jgi:hypothetical protein
LKSRIINGLETGNGFSKRQQAPKPTPKKKKSSGVDNWYLDEEFLKNSSVADDEFI